MDPQIVAAGCRAARAIGSGGVYEVNETIGKIDDLLVARDGKTSCADSPIVECPGMGTHMVAVRQERQSFATPSSHGGPAKRTGSPCCRRLHMQGNDILENATGRKRATKGSRYERLCTRHRESRCQK